MSNLGEVEDAINVLTGEGVPREKYAFYIAILNILLHGRCKSASYAWNKTGVTS